MDEDVRPAECHMPREGREGPSMSSSPHSSSAVPLSYLLSLFNFLCSLSLLSFPPHLRSPVYVTEFWSFSSSDCPLF